MDDTRADRAVSVLALLAIAAAGGAFAGVAGGAFIWLVESLIHLLWTYLPGELALDPFRSWWLFAVPVAGGVLVGLGQRLLGNYPEPLGVTIDKWRAGDQIKPSTVPAITMNSLSALVTGGPVGFEAALTGILGGIASWIGRRIRGAGDLVRQAWGAEHVDALPKAVASLPYWLAGLAGLVTYKSLPFGRIEMGFRFGNISDVSGGGNLLALAALAALLVVPIAWALRAVSWSESQTYFKRAPVVAAVAGALVFSLMALGNEYVLFSGQQIYQQLPELSTTSLAYLAAAKWAALVVTLLAGWRGGPIFPTITAASSIAVLVSGVVDVPTEVLMVAAVASVSMVFVKGKVAVGFVLSMYVVPLSNAGLILVGCVGAATALGLTRSFGWLPDEPQEDPATRGSDESKR